MLRSSFSICVSSAPGNVRDVKPELATAEEAVRKSDERYRELLASVTDYIYSVRLKDGVVIALSSLRDHPGLRPSELKYTIGCKLKGSRGQTA